MARIRSIHPDALKSEKLADASPEAERLYWRMQTQCDDEGRAEDDPRIFASYLFPLCGEITGIDVDRWLDELHDVGLIIRFRVDNHRVLQVTRWGDYQHPQRPTPSKLPTVAEADGGPFREPSRTAPRALPAGEGVGGGVGKGDGVVGVVHSNIVHRLGLIDYEAARDDGVHIRAASKYIESCIETREFIDGARIDRILDEHSDWDEDQIVQHVMSGHDGPVRTTNDGGARTIDGRTFLPGTGWIG